VHEVVQAREGATPDRRHQERRSSTLSCICKTSPRICVVWMRMTGGNSGLRRPGGSSATSLSACGCAWLTVCERLRLHPRVHAAMGEALEAAWRTQPEDPALQAAYRAWTRPKEHWTRLKRR